MLIKDKSYEALYHLVKNVGVKGAVSALATMLEVYADEMSDIGIKEKAMVAAEVSEMLQDMTESIDD